MWPALLVIAIFFLMVLWPIVLILIGIFILWLSWPRKEHQCTHCSEKFYSTSIRNWHLETCVVANRLRDEEQEKQRKWKEQKRKWEEQQSKEERKKEDWRKNWKTQSEWRFSEEEFWKIQDDIDERKENATRDLEEEKEKATEKLWERYYAAKSHSLADRIYDEIDEIEEEFNEKIEEIEEGFEEEEEKLWDSRNRDWSRNTSEEFKRAKEGYEKAKKEWKKTTGRDWNENDWYQNWKEAFEDILGKEVNIEECYETLGLTVDTAFGKVKERFRELALKFHPDKAQDKKIAEEKFKKIYEAYETIRMNQKDGIKA